MLKKIVLWTGVTIVIVIGAGYLFRDTIGQTVMAMVIAPDHAFGEMPQPSAPDYGNAEHWAAHPGKQDPSDDRPEGVASDTPGASVFFIHPTSYISKVGWNQPMDDADANWVVDHRVLRNQASVFNGCCDVYAPRYRQATFYSFMDPDGNGDKALDLAYTDVERAFDHFLAQIGGQQPFILAGHSQGSAHGIRLLRERIAGSDLASRLVGAYLIGFSISAANTGGVAACTTETDTACVVAWNTTTSDQGLFPDADNLICTNPLTWTDNGGYAAHALNRGGIGYAAYGRPVDGEDFTAMTVEANVADAACRNGMLVIDDLRSQAYPVRLPGGSLHVYDYGLFYLNLRDNVRRRVTTFLTLPPS